MNKNAGLMMNSNIYTLFFKELKYGAHITALIGPSLMLVMTILTNNEINLIAITLAYLIPLVVYSYNYLSEMDDDLITNSEKVEYLKKRKKAVPHLLLIYSIIAVLLIAIMNNINIIIFLLIIVSGGILYTTIFKVLTRYIIGFKSIFTTALWAYYGTFFTIFLYALDIDLLVIFISILMFLKLFINAIFFDIKDIQSDKNNGLKTIPIILGKQKTTMVMNCINVLAVILLIVGIGIGALPAYAIVLSIFFIYTYYYVNKGKSADRQQLLNYTYVMSDAEYFFWPIVLIIGKIGFTYFPLL